ncbi:MAG: GNAT family N-acetyltransferase [Methanocellales archaeon]
MENLEIANVNALDSRDFIEVYKLAYRGLLEYAYTSPRDIENYFWWLLKRDRNGFFKAILANRVVGFIACDTNWISYIEGVEVGEIHEIFVHPRFRGKGIGKKLVEKGIHYSKQRGRKICELWVGDRNELAKEFYRKLGFREMDKLGKWIRMVKEI